MNTMLFDPQGLKHTGSHIKIGLPYSGAFVRYRKSKHGYVRETLKGCFNCTQSEKENSCFHLAQKSRCPDSKTLMNDHDRYTISVHCGQIATFQISKLYYKVIIFILYR
jgi:hypothetical protein